MSSSSTELAPPVPAAAELPRLLAGALADRPLSLAEHFDRYGTARQTSGRSRSGELIELAAAAGLTGRGGAGFATARKLHAVADAHARPVVVANGVEGEPVSDKDKALLRHTPHLVLDGVALAAGAVGARKAIVALATGATHEIAAVRAALAERERRGIDRVQIRVAGVQDGFVAGEETAIIHSLNGGPATPTFTPPRPFERGVGGAPTLVQNVETLAHLALIARFGPRWFRTIGTAAEPGSALVTVGGAVARPGVYEVPLGLPVADLLAWAVGPPEPLSALLVGGYFGTWVAAEQALRLRLIDADLASAGASLGARAIFALPRSACGLIESSHVMRYLADESAGQCGPCVHGLDAIAGAFERLARGGRDAAGAPAQLKRWLGQVKGRGACRHPDGAARLVESALRVFSAEVELHTHGRCRGTHRAPLPITRAR
jgi:NADH:ubiquinone oxidoreductase subunit F (NADH-binding)